MPQTPKAFYDKRARCFASSAIGELCTDSQGRLYRKKVYNRDLTHETRDRLAAQSWLHAELVRLRADIRSLDDPTFLQVTEYYLEDLQARVSDETYARACEHLQRFGEWPAVGDPTRYDLRPARLIARKEAERFRDAMLDAGNSPSYIADGLLKTVKACFRWASMIEPGKYPGLPLPSNPIAGLKGPVVTRRRPRQINPVQVSRFIRWAWRRAVKLGNGPTGRHAQSAVVLLLTLRDTGARPKDLCVAEWSDWTFRPDGWGLIRLEAWKWKNGTKTGEERLIAVPPHCAKRIERIRALEGSHESRIFTHRRSRGHKDIGTPEAGEPWTSLDHVRRRKGHTKALQKWFLRMRLEGAKAGYELPEGFRLYFNRSAYITAARRLGANDVALAKAMGTSVRMLDTNYTDLDESDVFGVAKAARGEKS